MTDIAHGTTASRSRRPLALFGTLGAAGVLALAIALSSGFGIGSPGPVGTGDTPSTDPGAGGGMASCLVYDPASLPTFEIVFDGTVTAVDGDQVTFDVNTGWKGADGTITLTAPDANPALTGPLPEFAVGGRYLVTAAGSTINACGYTLDYDAQTAAEWGAAFAG
ncbi:MAG: hypothetical protein AB1627_03375 [Chloroflexota bacterium]